MMKIIILLVFSVGVFAATAAGTWFYLKSSSHEEAAETSHEDSHPSGNAAGPDTPHNSAKSPSHSPTSHAAASQAPAAKNAKSTPYTPTEDPPVAIRTRAMSVEELLRHGMGLKQRESALHAREEELQRQADQLKLVFADIEGEQKELEGLQLQLREQVQSTEKILQQVESERGKLATEKQDAEAKLKTFKDQQTTVNKLESENVKTMSQWLQSMEPAKAADVLKEMANDGKLKNAVELLSHFEERQASKVLSALNDPKLMVQLAEEFRKIRKSEAKSEP